jgi:hypothetical protein
VLAYLVLFLLETGQTDVLQSEAISVSDRLLAFQRQEISCRLNQSVSHHYAQTVKCQRSLARYHLQMMSHE